MSRRPALERHGPVARLLIVWSPLSGILVLYAIAEWINAPLAAHPEGSNRLGLGLHATAPAHLDDAVFGAVPSVWLQQHLAGGSAAGSPHWYDAVAALVYVTHFVSIPLVTGLVWFRLRHRFGAWLVAVLAFTGLGVLGYVLYPAVPPWLASQDGAVGPVSRISDAGWPYLHLQPVARLVSLGQGNSDPVAAMPSLHAGAALLVVLFLWPALGPLARAAGCGYVVLMAVVLVYTGEHFVVDVVAGGLVAAAAVTIASSVRRVEHAPTPADLVALPGS